MCSRTVVCLRFDDERTCDGDAIAAMEQLDRACRDPRPQLLAQQRVRHRVVVLLDLDVIVEAGPALLPLGVDVGLSRKWLERWPVQLLKQRAAARAEMPGDAVVQRCDTDRGSLRSTRRARRTVLLRSLAMIQRVATCTATSTFALSRGFLGRAGTMAVS